MRSILRSSKSFAVLLLFLLALLYLVSQNWNLFIGNWAPNGDIARGARTLFYSLAQGHLFFLILLMPFLISPAVVEERENSTLDLLISSPISIPHLTAAKLLSPLLFVILLLTAAFPVLSLCFFGGGLSLDEVGRTYLILLFSALSCSSLVMFCSTLRPRVYEVYLLSSAMTFLFVFLLPYHGVIWKYLTTIKWDEFGNRNHGFQYLCPFYTLQEELYPSRQLKGQDSWIPDPFLSISTGSLQFLGFAQGMYVALSFGSSLLFLLGTVARLRRIARGDTPRWNWKPMVKNLLAIPPARPVADRESDLPFDLTMQEGNPGLVLERRVQWFARVPILIRITYCSVMISIIILPLASYEGSWLFLTLPFLATALFTLPLSTTCISSSRERGTLDLLRASMLSADQIVSAKFRVNLQYSFFMALALYLPGMILQLVCKALGKDMDLVIDWADALALLGYPLLLFSSLSLYTMIGVFCSAFFRRSNRALIISGSVILVTMIIPFLLPAVVSQTEDSGLFAGTLLISFLSPLTGISILYPQGHTTLFTSSSMIRPLHLLLVRRLFAFLQCLVCLLLTYWLWRKTVKTVAEMD